MGLIADIGSVAAGIAGVTVLLAIPTIVNLLKFKPGLAVLTWFVPLGGPAWGWVGVCRLGKPSSLWANWFYDEEKMAKAEWRFS